MILSVWGQQLIFCWSFRMIIWSLAIVAPGLVAWGISCHQAQTHAVQSKPKILTENSKFKVRNVILTFFAVFSRVRTVAWTVVCSIAIITALSSILTRILRARIQLWKKITSEYYNLSHFKFNKLIYNFHLSCWPLSWRFQTPLGDSFFFSSRVSSDKGVCIISLFCVWVCCRADILNLNSPWVRPAQPPKCTPVQLKVLRQTGNYLKVRDVENSRARLQNKCA